VADGARARPPHQPVILGVSLKLYLDVATTVDWARRVATIARGHSAVRSGDVRLFVMPSLPAVPAVREAVSGTAVQVGAQNLHWDDRGPYTGEVSGADLRHIGCTLVEVGHAERRALFGEDDDIVRRKLAAAVRNDLTPVLCVGETDEATVEEAAARCLDELDSALEGLGAVPAADLIVAYEPVWAIGRPTPAPADHIAAVAGALRDRLASDERVAGSSVIYGGSAQRGTLSELGGGIDGLFLGRFAHDTASLARIIDEAAALR
jgi:triosephosphate isomerase